MPKKYEFKLPSDPAPDHDIMPLSFEFQRRWDGTVEVNVKNKQGVSCSLMVIYEDGVINMCTRRLQDLNF